MTIDNVKDLVESIKEGKFTSVGSYPKFWITRDGGVLSYEAVRENWRQIRRAIRTNEDDQWRVCASDINWEDSELFCDHTGKRIQSAYAES